MAQVTVTIGGRVYRMACGDGEERHLESLARSVDAKIDGLRGDFGEIGDQRIVVMAALTLADELSEAKRRMAEMEVDLLNLRQRAEGANQQGEAWTNDVAVALGEVARRIEGVTHGLNGARR